MTPRQLPLYRLTRRIKKVWRWAYETMWLPVLRWEARWARRRFHRPDAPGWHFWDATDECVGGYRVWRCRCGAERRALWPTASPSLGDGESSGWPIDVYDTVAAYFDDAGVSG